MGILQLFGVQLGTTLLSRRINREVHGEIQDAQQ